MGNTFFKTNSIAMKIVEVEYQNFEKNHLKNEVYQTKKFLIPVTQLKKFSILNLSNPVGLIYFS